MSAIGTVIIVDWVLRLFFFRTEMYLTMHCCKLRPVVPDGIPALCEHMCVVLSRRGYGQTKLLATPSQ